MTKVEAAKLMSMLVAAYPRGPWPDETRALYESELALLDAALAGEAVVQAIRTCKFSPAIAELIELHDGIRKAQVRRKRELIEERELKMLEIEGKRLVGNVQAELAAKIAGIGSGAA